MKLLRRVCVQPPYQKRSGDLNPQYFSQSTAVQMGGVLPYKWEVYCSTNGKRTAGCPFLRSLEARKVRRYKWGAYCRTNWRCTAVLFREVVGVGVSETLPTIGLEQAPPPPRSKLCLGLGQASVGGLGGGGGGGGFQTPFAAISPFQNCQKGVTTAA